LTVTVNAGYVARTMSADFHWPPRNLTQPALDDREHEFRPATRVHIEPEKLGTREQRIEFAQITFKTGRHYEAARVAARRILACDDGVANEAVRQWQFHPDVTEEYDRLGGERETINDGLPSKEMLAREIYNIGLDNHIDPDDRLRAFRLYAEVRGHIAKPGTNVNIDARSIILLPRRSTKLDDPEHEQKVIEAQARLVKDANTTG
jgi:hypothetical protein